jgi:hypothetical protein
MAPRKAGSTPPTDANEDRRQFLASCGKFAVVTPPAITMLLSTSLNSTAVAHSSGHGNGHGNGHGHGNGWWDWKDWKDDKPRRRDD